MRNVLKIIANNCVEKAFTSLGWYQPKMPKSLMEKAIDENKKED